MAAPPGAVRRTLLAWLARALGAALIVVVLLLVGFDDRVTDPQGREHRGRIAARGPDSVVLRTEGGEVTVPVADPRAVRPGLLTTFAALGRRPGAALLGALLQLGGFVAAILRWRVLLRAAGLPTPLRGVLRLGFIGLFCASLLPGGTAGGDVVRAASIAHAHPGRRARAALTVVADRLAGLLVLCAIALCAVVAAPAGSSLEAAAPAVRGLAVAAALGVLLAFSPRARSALGLPRLLARLPGRAVFREIGEAAALYARRKGALAASVALSLAAHGLALGAHALYGSALGDPLPWTAVLAAVPVAQMLQAVPGLPGGWGVGEFAYFFLLPGAGVPAAQAVALSITVRTAYTLLSLPGGLLLARLARKVS